MFLQKLWKKCKNALKLNYNKEYIICSAVWYKDLKLEKPEALEPRGFRPYNINKGIVFCGWRHMNCIYQMVAITGFIQDEAGEEIQGFLTNKNKFVNREEGANIALRANQVKNLKFGRNKLYSEDLY